MPQGCPWSSTLFCSNTPLSKVIQNHHSIGFHFCADNTQLYDYFTHKNVAQAFDRLKTWLDDVTNWLSANKLKLNPDITKLIISGSKTCEILNKSFTVNILGHFLSPAEVDRNLGVWFGDFSFSRHIQNICKSCFPQIWVLKYPRGYLTHCAALMAVNALVGSQLNYCNSLF